MQGRQADFAVSPKHNAEGGQFVDVLARKITHETGSDNIPARRRIYILQTGRETPSQWGVLSVKGNMEERAQELALYIIENKATVRAAASRFGISKSTVHTVI